MLLMNVLGWAGSCSCRRVGGQEHYHGIDDEMSGHLEVCGWVSCCLASDKPCDQTREHGDNELQHGLGFCN